MNGNIFVESGVFLDGRWVISAIRKQAPSYSVRKFRASSRGYRCRWCAESSPRTLIGHGILNLVGGRRTVRSCGLVQAPALPLDGARLARAGRKDLIDVETPELSSSSSDSVSFFSFLQSPPSSPSSPSSPAFSVAPRLPSSASDSVSRIIPS